MAEANIYEQAAGAAIWREIAESLDAGGAMEIRTEKGVIPIEGETPATGAWRRAIANLCRAEAECLERRVAARKTEIN